MSATIDQGSRAQVWYLMYWWRHSVYVNEYGSPAEAVIAAENGSIEGHFSPVAIFSPDGNQTSLWESSFYTAAEARAGIAQSLAELDDDEPLARLLRAQPNVNRSES
jgi:hypothetical protein